MILVLTAVRFEAGIAAKALSVNCSKMRRSQPRPSLGHELSSDDDVAEYRGAKQDVNNPRRSNCERSRMYWPMAVPTLLVGYVRDILV
jgi:hypothetical protein